LIFAVFGLLLLLTGAVLLLVPRQDQRAQTRGMDAKQVVSLAVQARDMAEQVNAPLSILFGLVSLYYSRKRYVVERDKAGKGEA
jgi:hypothetical protein